MAWGPQDQDCRTKFACEHNLVVKLHNTSLLLTKTLMNGVTYYIPMSNILFCYLSLCTSAYFTALIIGAVPVHVNDIVCFRSKSVYCLLCKARLLAKKTCQSGLTAYNYSLDCRNMTISRLILCKFESIC